MVEYHIQPTAETGIRNFSVSTGDMTVYVESFTASPEGNHIWGLVDNEVTVAISMRDRPHDVEHIVTKVKDGLEVSIRE
jgi:hypothetical protein